MFLKGKKSVKMTRKANCNRLQSQICSTSSYVKNALGVFCRLWRTSRVSFIHCCLDMTGWQLEFVPRVDTGGYPFFKNTWLLRILIFHSRVQWRLILDGRWEPLLSKTCHGESSPGCHGVQLNCLHTQPQGRASNPGLSHQYAPWCSETIKNRGNINEIQGNSSLHNLKGGSCA